MNSRERGENSPLSFFRFKVKEKAFVHIFTLIEQKEILVLINKERENSGKCYIRRNKGNIKDKIQRMRVYLQQD